MLDLLLHLCRLYGLRKSEHHVRDGADGLEYARLDDVLHVSVVHLERFDDRVEHVAQCHGLRLDELRRRGVFVLVVRRQLLDVRLHVSVAEHVELQRLCGKLRCDLRHYVEISVRAEQGVQKLDELLLLCQYQVTYLRSDRAELEQAHAGPVCVQRTPLENGQHREAKRVVLVIPVHVYLFGKLDLVRKAA